MSAARQLFQLQSKLRSQAKHTKGSTAAAQPKQFVLKLLDDLKAAGQEVNSLRLSEHLIAKTVCRVLGL